MAKRKLPKTLYVRWDYPQNCDPWMVVGETAEELLELPADEKRVGLYVLKEQVMVKSSVSVSVRAATSSRR